MQPAQTETPGLSLRVQRLKLAWVLALPFLYLSRFSPRLFVTGALVSLFGLILRAYAAGSIHKDRELARGGPYRFVRHPLYIGSFLVGFGFALAGGRWWFPPLFIALFLWVYRRAIRAEQEELELRFGEEYSRYREEVPAIFPRKGPGKSRSVDWASLPGTAPGFTPGAELKPAQGFRPWLYRRNKEWEAALGTLMGYGVLWAKGLFFG